MFRSLVSWASPRLSVVRFWAIDTGRSAEPRSIETAAVGDGKHDRPIAVMDVAVGADPEAIIRVARATGLTVTEAATRVRRGSHGASLTVGSDLASICWVSAGVEWIGEVDLWFEPPPGQAYVWSCVTRTLYRGRHLYPELLRRIVDDLSRHGFRRVWIASEIHNVRSARGIRRAGFQPVGLVSTFRLLGIHWRRITADPGASPRVVDDLRRGLRWSRRGEE